MKGSKNMEKFYVTTAIAYASRKPHFGNTYEIIMADAFARFQRRLGRDVYLCTGTDEHGQKIEELAKADGISPKAYVDRVAGEIKRIWDLMDTSYDYFIRTTDSYHEKAVAKIFKKFYDKGDIYKGFYEGWYCTPCESFFTETQVVDGKCPDCGREVKSAREEAYFFKMTKYADRLMKYIDEHPEFIEPESRKKEMVNNFLKAGLQDLCVSRTSFKWGIPVDFDKKHVVYVWLDALTNYITALGYDPDKSYDEQCEKFKKYWPCDVHIIGKDILRFHTIYWPIFLMALELPLPKKVFGHPWFNFGNDKMSKSKGNVVFADELCESFGVDGVRYYALSEMPYNSDGSITYENIITRYNNDLANNLGNLVSRTHAMTKKYFGGIVPRPFEKTELDLDLIKTVKEAAEKSVLLMGEYHVADSLDEIFAMLRRANKYIDETAPWILAKNEADRPRLASVIYNLLETIRIAAVLLNPYIPKTSENILSQLGTDKSEFDTAMAFGTLESGKPLGEAFTLFQRIDEQAFLKALEEKKAQAAAENTPAEEPMHEEEIGIDAFSKVELRVGKILECELVPKAKKLLKLQVDLGYEKRQVVSGIAKFYTPDELIGKKVVIVANLKPAKLCGVDSYGMLLASGDEDVKVVFLSDDAKCGDRIH
jgi:methionyl-tRNA synthetase